MAYGPIEVAAVDPNTSTPGAIDQAIRNASTQIQIAQQVVSETPVAVPEAGMGGGQGSIIPDTASLQYEISIGSSDVSRSMDGPVSRGGGFDESRGQVAIDLATSGSPILQAAGYAGEFLRETPGLGGVTFDGRDIPTFEQMAETSLRSAEGGAGATAPTTVSAPAPQPQTAADTGQSEQLAAQDALERAEIASPFFTSVSGPLEAQGPGVRFENTLEVQETMAVAMNNERALGSALQAQAGQAYHLGVLQGFGGPGLGQTPVAGLHLQLDSLQPKGPTGSLIGEEGAVA